MGTISTIFKREIGAYLRSPLGWIVACLLLLIDGVLFQWIISEPRLSADVMYRFLAWTGGLVIVAGLILSVGLITEERAKGTMVLYRTAPGSEWQVVVGKFLAALLFLTGVILATLYIPLLIKGKISSGHITVGYIGLILLGATSLAIGMFASSLTRNILIAIFVAVVITVLMVLIYQVSRQLDPPLKDVGAMIDMWWERYEKGTALGILSLSNVVYYLSMIYLFLLLATKAMEAHRWR